MLVASRVQEADEVLRELLAGPGAGPTPIPSTTPCGGSPPCRSELDGVWYLSSYRACRTVLLDRRAGKNRLGLSVRFGVNEELIRRIRSRQRPSMINANPPEHGRRRKAARGPFLPGRMEARLQQRIEEIVDERLDVVAAKGEADMMADVAFKLPVTVIGELVGVPPDDRDEFPPLVDEFFAAGQVGATPEQMDRADRAGERFREYFAGLVEAQRAHPNQDLVGSLVADGNLSEDELQGTIILIFIAGFITTANLIGNGLFNLLRRPGEMARLWADPDLVPNAVEEMLRFDTPVQLVAPPPRGWPRSDGLQRGRERARGDASGEAAGRGRRRGGVMARNHASVNSRTTSSRGTSMRPRSSTSGRLTMCSMIGATKLCMASIGCIRRRRPASICCSRYRVTTRVLRRTSSTTSSLPSSFPVTSKRALRSTPMRTCPARARALASAGITSAGGRWPMTFTNSSVSSTGR